MPCATAASSTARARSSSTSPQSAPSCQVPRPTTLTLRPSRCDLALLHRHGILAGRSAGRSVRMRQRERRAASGGPQQKMRDAGQREDAIRSFSHAYERLVGGRRRRCCRAASSSRSATLPRSTSCPRRSRSRSPRVAVIKLNGGLATTMGLRPARNRWSRRATAARSSTSSSARRWRYAARHGVGAAAAADGQRGDAARDARRARGVTPISTQERPDRLPPGHGAQARRRAARAGQLAGSSRRSNGAHPVTATSTARCARSGILARAARARLPPRDDLQRRQPRRDARTRGSPRSWRASAIPFLMEVVEGTEADRKGGHIARRRADGSLVLRETAQTPPSERGVLPRLPALALLQHEQPLGRSRRARRHARARMAACSSCR